MRRTGLFVALLILCVDAMPANPALAQEEAPRAAELDPIPGLKLESLSATRTLPLFTPSRSAPVVVEEPPPEVVPVEPEVVVAPEPTPPPLQLIGIVVTLSEQVAVFVDQGTGEIHRLRSGEVFQDWTMRIVDTRTVEFQNDGRRHALTLFEDFDAAPPGGMPYDEQFYEGQVYDGQIPDEGPAPTDEQLLENPDDGQVYDGEVPDEGPAPTDEQLLENPEL